MPRGRAYKNYYSINDFSLGYDNNTPDTMLDPRSMTDLKNFNLNNKRGLSKRGGMSKLYSTTAGASKSVRKLYEYKAPNGTNYVLVQIDTKIRSYYSSTWNDLKTGLTADKPMTCVTHRGSCICTNGTDANVRLYNTTAYTVGVDAPAAAPTVATGAAGNLTGDYKYKYCYIRDSNGYSQAWSPSAASATVSPSSEQVTVTVVASTDTNVNHIWLYRTLAGGDTYYKQGEHANTSGDITDDTVDNSLTTLLDADNDKPPLAKFVVLHKDRVFYLNCPNETAGEHLVQWSKTSESEAIGTNNYQFFDAEDGEAITGGASLGNYLIVFKRNKISVIAGDLDVSSELYTIGTGIGCIASWAILTLEDKVIFLSEEGWKATDGQKIYALSEKIDSWGEDGYYTIDENMGYSVAYYPEKKQFHFLMKHSTLTDKVAVGHFLVPLLLVSKGVCPEEAGKEGPSVGSLIGWTYHQYDNDTLTTLGTYTDASGITKLIAGDDGGFVYVLDDGTDDDGEDIAYQLRTDWLNLGSPRSFTKTCRKGRLSYYASGATTLTFNIEKDFSDTDDTQSISPTASGSFNTAIHLSGTAEYFRFTISGDDQKDININGFTVHFRDEGVR